MKMQLITIEYKKHGFTITRDFVDWLGIIDRAYCNIDRISEHAFIASGFSSIFKPAITHDKDNKEESIDDFIKVVFAKPQNRKNQA